MKVFGQTIFQLFTNAFRSVLAADTGFLVGEGLKLTTAAALLAWCVFGISVMLKRVEFGPGIADLVILLAFVVAMEVFWNRPLPFGQTFPGIVTGWAEYLSKLIGWDSINAIMARSSAIWGGAEPPSWTNPLGVFNYCIIGACFLFLQAVCIAAVLVGLYMEAVLKLLGPLFPPFLLIPHLGRVFWGWFYSFLGFSFIQVMAAAVLRIAANVLVPAMNALPDHMSIQFQAGAVAGLLGLLFSILFVCLKLPQWTNWLFSGSSGDGMTHNWWRR